MVDLLFEILIFIGVLCFSFIVVCYLNFRKNKYPDPNKGWAPDAKKQDTTLINANRNPPPDGLF